MIVTKIKSTNKSKNQNKKMKVWLVNLYQTAMFFNHEGLSSLQICSKTHKLTLRYEATSSTCHWIGAVLTYYLSSYGVVIVGAQPIQVQSLICKNQTDTNSDPLLINFMFIAFYKEFSTDTEKTTNIDFICVRHFEQTSRKLQNRFELL